MLITTHHLLSTSNSSILPFKVTNTTDWNTVSRYCQRKEVPYSHDRIESYSLDIAMERPTGIPEFGRETIRQSTRVQVSTRAIFQIASY